MVAVPAEFVRSALRILDITSISEAELTRLALADHVDSMDAT
jgi:hypothetical protein